MLAARAGLVPGLPLSTRHCTSGRPGSRRRPRCRICVSARRRYGGYDPEFMALILAALGVAGEDIAAGDVWVATGADGQIPGVVALAPCDAPGALDLNKLFIEPRHIRSGVGRALLAHAIAEARRRGARRLTILADPSAAAFYERAGAVRIGEAPSDAVPGRLLPLYEVRLDSTGDRDLADPSAKRPSAVRASFGEPAELLRIGEARSPGH
jgi:GNAT superfamily N-acetyltransferase